MSLASILYPAPTDQGLEEFFWANSQHHLALIDAVKQTMGVTMELFQIYPVTPGASLSTWEAQHQRQHDVLARVLGVPSTDLTSLDLKDKKAFDAWAFSHFLQHQAAGQLCGMSI